MSLLEEAKKTAAWVINAANARTVADALQNLMSGIGTARDKSQYSRYVDAPILTVFDLETLWKDSALTRKIVSKIPQDALRAGFKVTRKNASPDDNAVDAKAIADRCNELGVTQKLFKAACWGRLFGGGGIVMSVIGAGPPQSELDHSKITGIDYLRVCDRQDFTPSYWAPDGSTERWWWQRQSLGGGPIGMPVIDIHTTRILWFGGAMTTDRARARNQYWDLSIIQAMFNTLVSYDGFWASLDAQVGDSSQAVFHLQGFLSALASNSGETGEALRKRLQLMDMNRSNARALVMDAGDKDGNGREEYQVIERASLASMGDLGAFYQNRVATEAGYPVSILFEQAAAGTNATGEGDKDLYFNSVGCFQNDVLTRPATILVQDVARDLGISEPEEWEVVWPPLFIPKPLDVASAEKMKVDSAVGLVGAGIVLEEEVALSLSEMAPGLHLHVDREARAQALEAGLLEVKDRTVMDPSAGEIAAQTAVKAAAKPSPAPKASGRAEKAKANPASSKNSPRK